ncbi:glycosyltransferase [candidate division WOR-3 bacterium]|nr:glycosyltransferase [candidate division WOR-3 bacterium]MCK4329035.1 glycosyltransferase [candidate division WOR-3 bacterium]
MRQYLEDYRSIVGDEIISMIYKKARSLYGKHILHINSTYQGGGVAEILAPLVALMNDIGVDTGWRILHGNPDFFTITKKIHNALQGDKINLSEIKKRLYTQANEKFSVFTHIDHDCVISHDPQPLPLIKFYKKRQPWIWRCHIDLSDPHQELWNYLKGYMLKYDMIIFSSEKYKKVDLPVGQRLIYPAIDPLSLKNRELPEKVISKYIKKAGIPTDKPLITQVSRMDPWKDPEGLLKIYEHVKKKVDCRLLYCYNLATDDPESIEIYSRVYRKAKKRVEMGDVIFVMGNNDILVNSIQRFSSVIVQKSTREGFCLAVTEALWKGKPVVASNVGGIPLQIKDGINGFLHDPYDREGYVESIVKILKNPSIGEDVGRKAKNMVRENFLITRLLSDYLDLLTDIV